MPEIIRQLLRATRSERESRVIDGDRVGSTNGKEKEGYLSSRPSISTFVADPPT